MQGGYSTNFGAGISNIKSGRGIEDQILMVTFKSLISRLTATPKEIKAPENMVKLFRVPIRINAYDIFFLSFFLLSITLISPSRCTTMRDYWWITLRKPTEEYFDKCFWAAWSIQQSSLEEKIFKRRKWLGKKILIPCYRVIFLIFASNSVVLTLQAYTAGWPGRPDG